MFKRVIANALFNPGNNLGVDVDCSQFTSCGLCIAQEGCGFCGNVGTCVDGGWFGALNKSTCGFNDYYYHQCHLSTLPLGIIFIVLTSIVVISLFIGISIFCCCLCCQCCQDGQQDQEDENEDRPLLGSRYLKRTPTYYQWNKSPIPSSPTQSFKNKKMPADELPPNNAIEQSSWENRRTALLKKYARDEPVARE